MARESIRLAFVTALQHLPAQQRAVLILREVLRWQATEVAELLDTTVASVNSALQRARATLAGRDLSEPAPAEVMDPDQRALLGPLRRRLRALRHHGARGPAPRRRRDVDAALQLLAPGARRRWRRFFLGQGIGCQGSRLLATAANGQAAFGSYQPDPAGGWVTVGDPGHRRRRGRIVGHHNFLDTDLFAVFGLPARPRRLAEGVAGDKDVVEADEVDQRQQLGSGVAHA